MSSATRRGPNVHDQRIKDALYGQGVIEIVRTTLEEELPCRCDPQPPPEPRAGAALARIAELGGAVLTPAEDTPHGRMAHAADPTGASFKIVAS